MPLNLPACEAKHLLDHLDSLGWVMSPGMGLSPLTATEIFSWSYMTRTPLEPWEFQAIRTASSAYCVQSQTEQTIEPALTHENLHADD